MFTLIRRYVVWLLLQLFVVSIGVSCCMLLLLGCLSGRRASHSLVNWHSRRASRPGVSGLASKIHSLANWPDRQASWPDKLAWLVGFMGGQLVWPEGFVTWQTGLADRLHWWPTGLDGRLYGLANWLECQAWWLASLPGWQASWPANWPGWQASWPSQLTWLAGFVAWPTGLVGRLCGQIVDSAWLYFFASRLHG